MTLIIGLIAKDGIVLTADSREISGYPATSAVQSNDTVQKIFKITDHCGIGMAGSGEIAVTLIRELQHKISKLNNSKLDVFKISEEFTTLCLTRYDGWFGRLPPDSERIPDFDILICGYEKNSRGKLANPKIIKMMSYFQFAPMTATTGNATLGINNIADYLLNRIYIRDEMSLKQVLRLAAYCVVETESQDYRVGGNIQAAVFSNTKKFREITDSEIIELTTQCDEVFRENLQRSFFEPEPIEKLPAKHKEKTEKAVTKGLKAPKKDAVKKN